MSSVPSAAHEFSRLLTDKRIQRGHDGHRNAPGGTWSLATLAGRLAELSSCGATASLTAATALIHEAQRNGEPAAWVTTWSSTFFPPDLDDSGVDLATLPVVCVADVRAGARAVEELLRSGGFGVVVLDLGNRALLPIPMQTRLAGLAKKHRAALLCLTRKRREAPSLGSLVSIRGAGSMHRTAFDRFTWEITILKDKQQGPGWRHAEVYRGPDGLC